MATKTCADCGVPLIGLGYVFAKRCKSCVNGGASDEPSIVPLFAEFERTGFTSLDPVLGWALSQSMPRLLLGMLITNAAFLAIVIPGLGRQHGVGGSWLIWAFLVWLVGVTVFWRSHPLDRVRWGRWIAGDAAGYVLSMLAIIGIELAQDGAVVPADLVIAAVIGIITGMVNIWRSDAADRHQMARDLEAWLKLKGVEVHWPVAPVSVAPGSAGVQPVVDVKECPICAETIKVKAIKCRFCGHVLAQA